MQIRRYTGAELGEVLQRIQRELGPHAAIINTRKVHQGLFGILGRPAVEVTVAVDYDGTSGQSGPDGSAAAGGAADAGDGGPGTWGAAPAPAEPRARVLPSALARRSGSAGGGPAGGVAESRGRARGRPAPSFARPPESEPYEPAPLPRDPLPRVVRASAEDPMLTARRELNELRVKPRGGGMAAPMGEPPPASLGMSEDLERVYRILVRNQVEMDIARSLLRIFDEQLSLLGEDWTRAQPRFERFLAGLIRATPGIQLRAGHRPHVAMFIGPTGVGKTTTIAKIASLFSLVEHRKVAIVTADTYRMAATDQMKRYGQILGIPVHVAESAEDMEQAMIRLSGYDLVLVDTAGRSPQHKEHMKQMRDLVEAARPDEIHLVVSLTTKYVDVLQIVARFGIVGVNRVIVTKADETRTYGLILNLSMKFNMEVAYLTNGQQVPDDIEPADQGKLAKLVLAGYGGDNGRPGRPAS
ncbi:MAG: flagellar biosynthesis protein FlhF [Candidatus Coatesbacteria bacterium]